MNCPKCSKEHQYSAVNAYCPDCKKIENGSSRMKFNYSFDSTTRLGTVHELMVAVDLIKKGYEVYHAFSASAHCDFVAVKEGRILRIEVTTGTYRISDNKLLIPPTKMKERAVHNRDILALVTPIEIVYLPNLDASFEMNECPLCGKGRPK